MARTPIRCGRESNSSEPQAGAERDSRKTFLRPITLKKSAPCGRWVRPARRPSAGDRGLLAQKGDANGCITTAVPGDPRPQISRENSPCGDECELDGISRCPGMPHHGRPPLDQASQSNREAERLATDAGPVDGTGTGRRRLLETMRSRRSRGWAGPQVTWNCRRPLVARPSKGQRRSWISGPPISTWPSRLRTSASTCAETEQDLVAQAMNATEMPGGDPYVLEESPPSIAAKTAASPDTLAAVVVSERLVIRLHTDRCSLGSSCVLATCPSFGPGLSRSATGPRAEVYG